MKTISRKQINNYAQVLAAWSDSLAKTKDLTLLLNLFSMIDWKDLLYSQHKRSLTDVQLEDWFSTIKEKCSQQSLDFFRHFLYVLYDSHSFILLSKIATAYHLKIFLSKKGATIRIESAIPFTDSIKYSLIQKIESSLGFSVIQAEYYTNPKLILGFRLFLPDGRSYSASALEHFKSFA